MKKLLYLGLTALTMLFSLGSARGQDEAAAKVKVTLEPATWTRGLSAPRFKVDITPGQGSVELGTDQDKLAVKVTFTKQDAPAAKTEITQLLTADETPLKPSTKVLEDGTWNLSYELMKGDNSAAFGDEAEVADDCDKTLTVATPILTFNPANGEIEEGSEITITCSESGIGNEQILYSFYADMETAKSSAPDDFDYLDGEFLDSGNPTIEKDAPVLAAAIYDNVTETIIAITYAEYTVKEKPKVMVTLNPNTWKLESTPKPTFVLNALALAEKDKEMGDEEGKLSIKVKVSKDANNFEQRLTGSGIEIETDKLTEEGDWTIDYELQIKSGDAYEAYTGAKVSPATDKLTVQAAAVAPKEAAITVTLAPAEWIIGESDKVTATVAMNPADAFTLGNEVGDYAIRVLFRDSYESPIETFYLTSASSELQSESFATLEEYGADKYTLEYSVVKVTAAKPYPAYTEVNFTFDASTEEFEVKAGTGGDVTTLEKPTITSTRIIEGKYAGLYVKGDKISISAETGATIWYTLDGTTPEADEEKAHKYTGPFELEESSKPIVIKAIAAKGDVTSEEAQAKFFFLDISVDLYTLIGESMPIDFAGYGKYVPFSVWVMIEKGGSPISCDPKGLYAGVYYTIDGKTDPDMDKWEEGNKGPVYYVDQLDTAFHSPMMMLTQDNVEQIKIKVYLTYDGELVAESEVFDFDVYQGAEVPELILDPSPYLSKVTSEPVKIENADDFVVILYTKDGSIPTYDRHYWGMMKYDEPEANLFVYDAETGIEIEGTETIKVIGYTMGSFGGGGMDPLDLDDDFFDDPMGGGGDNTMFPHYGSDMVTATYTLVKKPELSLNPDPKDGAVAHNTEVIITNIEEIEAAGYAVTFDVYPSKEEAFYPFSQYGASYPVVTKENPLVLFNLYNAETGADFDYYVTYQVNDPSDVPMPQIQYQGNAMADEIGLYTKGQKVKIVGEGDEYKVWYTIDGSAPKANEAQGGQSSAEITLDKSMVIKAIAVKEGEASDVATAHFTLYEDATLTFTLVDLSRYFPVTDSVGKNIGIDVNFNVKESPELGFNSPSPAVIYYSIDGETDPTMEAYKQDDTKVFKAEGKLIESEYGNYVTNPYIYFNQEESVNLKARVYLNIELGEGEGGLIFSDVLSKEIDVVFGLQDPVFDVEAGEVHIGDTLRIKNLNDSYAEETDAIFFSVNGELPFSHLYEGVYQSGWNVSGDEENDALTELYAKQVIVVFQQDENGMYAYIPSNTKYYDGSDKIRIKDGKLKIQAICYDYTAYGIDGRGEPGMLQYGSNFVAKEYTVKPKALDPVFSVAAGKVTKGTKVAINCATEGAKIYYTTNGTEPTQASTEFKVGDTIVVTQDTTIMAIAICADMDNSEVVKAVYVIDTVKAPTFSVAAGEVVKGTKVAIECATKDAKIYYTTNGDVPTVESTEYTDSIAIESDMTIKAIAYRADMVISPVAVAAYVAKEEAQSVATPTFSVPAGEVAIGTKVEIKCATEGAVIYYTLDGTTPDADATEYKDAIVINEAVTIKAIAIKGELKSEVATASYTVSTAVEGAELAGVNIYPTPNDGKFNVVVPVDATVVVFTANGQVVRRMEVAAGVHSLQLANSGIYFVRLTAANGQSAVKRVVVR